MLIFRLVFGALLLASLLCFGMALGTGDRRWRQRGLLLLKWTLIAALGFFGVLVLQRVVPMI